MFKPGNRHILHLVCCVLLLASGEARGEVPVARIRRVVEAPKIVDFTDGTFTEDPEGITDFRQREPGDGVPSSRKTSAYLSFDDSNLYVVFVCEDEPGKIRAHMAKREDVTGDDLVAVYLDTFRDRQRAYIFASNPYGIQLDGIITEGQADDYTFDALWQSEGRLTERGYVVRMAIPFKSLRFPKGEEQTWGIALERIIPHNSEESYWPYVTKRVQGFVQQFASAQVPDAASPGRNMQFIPYGIATRARYLDTPEDGNPGFVRRQEYRYGLDAKVVLRDALTLDAAANPDFSQVESDQPQVTINRRFEVFFPERRPFFIENAGYFQTPQNLFFSRRIAEPQFGLRMTGKIGRFAIGALAADDRGPGHKLDPGDRLFDKRALFGAGVVRREFGQQSSVGLLVTSRDFGPSFNRVASLDTRLRLNRHWVLSGQVMRSFTKTLDGKKSSGPGYFAEISRGGRGFKYSLSYLDLSPDFLSQTGFIKRVDVRQVQQEVEYNWRPENRWIVKFGPQLSTMANWNRKGQLQDWEAQCEFEIELKRQTKFKVIPARSFELFKDFGFQKRWTTVEFSTEWFRWMGITASHGWGTEINYDPAEGLTPFLGRAVESSLTFTLRPIPQIRFDQSYVYSLFRTDPKTLVPETFRPISVFNNHILQSKLNYQLTRALSVRVIVNYEVVLPNTTFVALEREKRLNGDVLLTYLINPWTAIYLGYSDVRENLSIGPTVSDLQRVASPLMSTERQFFIKLSYLFRF